MLFAEAEQALGAPSGNFVYSFEERTCASIYTAMRGLRLGDQQVAVTTYPVPWVSFDPGHITSEYSDGERSVTLPVPTALGKKLLLIEPHCDDVALSVAGTLFRWGRPLVVVTLFNLSRTKDDRLPVSKNLDDEKISELRRAENECALGLGLGAQCLFLDEWEEPWPWGPPDDAKVKHLAERVASVVDLTDVEIAAPFAFSGHPDHYLARRVAETLGCNLFWEDIGFYREYSRCLEDREFGWERWGGEYEEVVSSIDGYALQKMALLTTYQSQMYPPVGMMSVLRYHWAVARQTGRSGGGLPPSIFAERLYRRR